MEETLGKRIIANRKRLGMTQDKLAEQLGVTAQAVSKWENDQSCPDITTLPKLAEIFGTTTDALLGIASQPIVHEAEIIREEASVPEGLHINNGLWEFQYDGGKKSSIGIALWVLLSGGLLLASNLLNLGAGFWDILWPTGLLVFGLFGLYPKFSFFRLACSLFGLYFLLNELDLWGFSFGKEYLLPVFLLLFGLSLLVSALKKRKTAHFVVKNDGKVLHDSDHKQESSFSSGPETFDCSTVFGHNRQYIDVPRLSKGEAEVVFGELLLDLSGCGEIVDSCTLELDCTFGHMTVLVPQQYKVDISTESCFGSVEQKGQYAAEAKDQIRMNCSVTFGQILIQYL